jgi:hypothetical protein
VATLLRASLSWQETVVVLDAWASSPRLVYTVPQYLVRVVTFS